MELMLTTRLSSAHSNAAQLFAKLVRILPKCVKRLAIQVMPIGRLDFACQSVMEVCSDISVEVQENVLLIVTLM